MHAVSLDLVISPYDISARSAAAVSACWLGDRVVTLLPAPSRPGDGGGAPAVRASPAMARLAESWDWSAALWKAGVLVAGAGADAVSEAVLRELGTMRADPRMAPLRLLLDRAEPAESEKWFDSVCRDLVLGGSNPAVSVPLASAMENFASGHDLAMFRLQVSSLVGRLERASSKAVFRFTALTLIEADAGDLVMLRSAMSESLGALRVAIDELLAVVRSGAAQGAVAGALAAVEARRGEYEPALMDRLSQHRASASASGQRIKLAQVTLTGSISGPGTAMAAAAAAARSVRAGPPGALATSRGRATRGPESQSLARAGLITLTMKPLPFQAEVR